MHFASFSKQNKHNELRFSSCTCLSMFCGLNLSLRCAHSLSISHLSTISTCFLDSFPSSFQTCFESVLLSCGVAWHRLISWSCKLRGPSLLYLNFSHVSLHFKWCLHSSSSAFPPTFGRTYKVQQQQEQHKQLYDA